VHGVENTPSTQLLQMLVQDSAIIPVCKAFQVLLRHSTASIEAAICNHLSSPFENGHEIQQGHILRHQHENASVSNRV